MTQNHPVKFHALIAGLKKKSLKNAIVCAGFFFLLCFGNRLSIFIGLLEQNWQMRSIKFMIGNMVEWRKKPLSHQDRPVSEKNAKRTNYCKTRSVVHRERKKKKRPVHRHDFLSSKTELAKSSIVGRTIKEISSRKECVPFPKCHEMSEVQPVVFLCQIDGEPGEPPNFEYTTHHDLCQPTNFGLSARRNMSWE